MEVYLQVLVLFLLLLLGFLTAKFKWLSAEGLQGLNKFVVLFAMPALTIVKLQVAADGELLFSLFMTFLYGLIAMLLCGAIAFALLKKESKKRRAVLTSLAMFGNSGFMGYPIVAARFGEDAVIYAVMFVTAFTFLAWTVGTALYGQKGFHIKQLFATPSVLAVVIGLAMLLFQIPMPAPVNDALTMVAATTTPLSMVVIGARLVSLPISRFREKGLLLACALRLVVFPLLFLFTLRLIKVPELIAAVLFLCYAMPGSASTAMQADFFDCDPPFASQAVAMSTAFSMVSIPLMLLFIA